jgi:hypothetical protein
MKLELRVLDQDSFSPLFHAIVTIRLAGSKTDEKKGGTGKPTEGEGILKFNSMGAGELEINGCRQDHVPSGWKRWGELESDEKGRKVLMLKVSTSKIPVFCPDPDQPTRPTGSAAGGRGL